MEIRPFIFLSLRVQQGETKGLVNGGRNKLMVGSKGMFKARVENALKSAFAFKISRSC